MLNSGPNKPAAGHDVFSRQKPLFAAVAGMYSPATQFFALDKLLRPAHYRPQTRTRLGTR
jgi:hypothetical protein